MHRLQLTNFWTKMTILASLSAIFYSSWPLGYWLNPALAHNGFGSQLEAVNQPYNWLFVICDVVSSTLISIVAWLIWRRLRCLSNRRFTKIVLINISIFALGTILGALIPLDCGSSNGTCPNYHQDPTILFHGAPGVIAAICLFISLALVWWQRRRWLWLTGLTVVTGILGLLGLLSLLIPGAGHGSQHVYLTLCSVWLLALPYTLWAVSAKPSPATED